MFNQLIPLILLMNGDSKKSPKLDFGSNLGDFAILP